MIGIILYAIGVMYTPGPVNLLGLNAGLQQKFKRSIGYFIGVGSAMFILFILFGYSGQLIIKKSYLIYISIIGSSYIIYLAVKLFKATVNIYSENNANLLTFKNGLFMQLLNPKGYLATLPIATIQFPANHITGMSVFFTSLFLGVLAIGAPGSYSVAGRYFGKLVKDIRVISYFNKLMALLLLYVAFTILKDHVYNVLIGVSQY